MKITNEEADVISQRWIDLWNNDSVKNYLDQYTTDATLVSNVALRLFPDSNGRISGKELLLDYWELVRVKFPFFKFIRERFEVFENKVVVYYASTVNETKAIAILTMNEQMLIRKIEVSYV